MIKRFMVVVSLILFLVGCRSSILDDPTTRISYTIEQPAYVKIEVENSYNTVVATLVNGQMAKGTYSVSFDASKLPEGVYYYTVECTGTDTTYYYKSTKTLLLIK